jgi:hypothetical protein
MKTLLKELYDSIESIMNSKITPNDEKNTLSGVLGVMKKYLKKEEQDNWISVKDFLPEENVNVLVFGEQKGMNPNMGGAYIFITKREVLKYQNHNLHLRNQYDENNFKSASYVLKWQPLPKKPNK